MILDHLDRAGYYAAISPGIARALEALRDGIGAKPDGRYEIDGDGVVALVQSYQSKTTDFAVWETHQRYIDVQFIVEGAERMGCVGIDKACVKQSYDSQRDAAFYEAPASG